MEFFHERRAEANISEWGRGDVHAMRGEEVKCTAVTV